MIHAGDVFRASQRFHGRVSTHAFLCHPLFVVVRSKTPINLDGNGSIVLTSCMCMLRRSLHFRQEWYGSIVNASHHGFTFTAYPMSYAGFGLPGSTYLLTRKTDATCTRRIALSRVYRVGHLFTHGRHIGDPSDARIRLSSAQVPLYQRPPPDMRRLTSKSLDKFTRVPCASVMVSIPAFPRYKLLATRESREAWDGWASTVRLIAEIITPICCSKHRRLPGRL